MSRSHALSIVVPCAVGAALAFAAVASSHDAGPATDQAPGGSKIAKVFDQMLPKGDYQKVSAITVDYGPGGNTPKHRHDVAVFAYVLEGEIESQLAGEELKTFRAGAIVVRVARHRTPGKPQRQPGESRSCWSSSCKKRARQPRR